MTTNKSDLELALEHLINEDREKAIESFHKFIVSKARALHEEMASEDEIDEDINEASEEMNDDEEAEKVEESETYFGEDDLENELGSEMPADMSADVAVDDLGGGMDAEVAGDEMGGSDEIVGATDEVEAFKDALSDLQAKFAALVGDEVAAIDAEAGEEPAFGGEEEVDGDEPAGEENVEEAVSHEMGVATPSNFKTGNDGKHGNKDSIKMNGDAKLPESFEFDLTEDDFLSLEEGLSAVSVKMGGEQGGNKFAGEEVNTKSPVAQKSKADMGVKSSDMVSKKSEHNGYGLETAPTSGKLPHAGDNSKKSADVGRSAVAKEGNKSALLNKETGEGFGKINDKSPIGSKGSKQA